MLVARIMYDLIPVGILFLLYCSAAVYLFSLLGLGFLIATYTQTQLQAMSILLFLLMIFNLMSGIFTPADSMPDWAKFMSHLFPVSHFVKTIRMIVLKGSNFFNVLYHLLALFLIGIVFNIWAVINYKTAI